MWPRVKTGAPKMAKSSASSATRLFGSTCSFSEACVSVMPRRSRAARNRAPMPLGRASGASGVIARLRAGAAVEVGERWRLLRGRKFHAQRARIMLRRDAIAHGACDTHAEKQKIGRRLEAVGVMGEHGARIVQVPALEFQIRQLIGGFGEIGLDGERVLQVLLG